MQTYTIHTESWKEARPLGVNRDGSTAMNFEDVRETEITVRGFRAALAEAKAQRQAIDFSGRGGAVAMRCVETGAFRLIARAA